MTREISKAAAKRLLEAAAPLLEDSKASIETGFLDFERFEIGEELGRGGMGVVYEAFDRELERKIALKVLSRTAGFSEAARERFVREARAAARLVHPHIAVIYDATPECIAMQRIDGKTIGEDGPVDARRAAALIRDAALAMHYAHSEGIVHRDLKPQNLMVEEGERPHIYVMDFGLAKEFTVAISLSQSGSVIGTPAFMAPEQAGGRNTEVGPRTDVYGLGACLWAALAGRAPFEGDDLIGVLRRVAESNPPALESVVPSVPRDLALIVGKCMEKEAVRRYPSALALASDLDRWLRGEAIQARPPSVIYKLVRFASRRQGAIVTAIGSALLVFLVALPFFINARGERRLADRGRVIAEQTLALSNRVIEALGNARAVQTAGSGRERGHFPILQEAIDECEEFLAVNQVGHVWFFLGRLLREQGRFDEALVALDTADELQPDIDQLHRERGLVLASLYRISVVDTNPELTARVEDWRARGAMDLRRALSALSPRATVERVQVEGQLAWLEGNLELAIARHREVIEMEATSLESHLSLSRLYLLTENVEQAMRHSVIAGDLYLGYGPAYVAGGGVLSSAGEPMAPERELLKLDGLDELIIDFNLLLALEPGEARSRGLRAQTHLRTALRAKANRIPDDVREEFEIAIDELDASLRLDPGHAAALLNRAVTRVQLARLRAAAGESSASARTYEAALADYDECILADPTLAVARFDRALFFRTRAQYARIAMEAGRAAEDLERAKLDANSALELIADDHPFRAAFEELAASLPHD